MVDWVFFLLIGKWFQRKIYDTITYKQNYEFYFPIFDVPGNEDKSETVALIKL